jgi:hypothetical protein
MGVETGPKPGPDLLALVDTILRVSAQTAASHTLNRASRLAAPPSRRQLHVSLFDRSHANLVLSG